MEIPQSRVAIRYIGLRPGEKLDEELFFADERQEPTRHSLVLGATRAAASLEAIQRWRKDLERAVAEDASRAGKLLMEFARLESEAAGGQTQEAAEAAVKSADSGVAEEAVR
jgi:FlaA1/EpsC-like NDP-sugar epimerase